MSLTAERVGYRRSRSPERLFDDAPTHGAARIAATRRLKLDGEGGESTLDELLAGVWERLTVHAVATCPLCGGRLDGGRLDGERPNGQRLDGEHAAQNPSPAIHGRCRDCGTSLS